jgi:anti-sigma regulatory factor (Ser/Thr protein kinase)
LEAAFVAIEQSSDVSEARRMAQAIASEHGFDESERGKVGLIVTEAARNLLKHAGRGDIVLRATEAGSSRGVEMLAVDKGPGIADVGRCFRDGFSTAGTPGTGLGAIARLSTLYDIYSRPGKGTVLMAQIWVGGHRLETPRFRVGAVSRALPGEPECGDGWIFQERARGGRLTLADGLGHGKLAADAAHAAVSVAGRHGADSAPHLLEKIHAVLRPTRGAAVAVSEIDSPGRTVHFAGVGNIAAAVIPPEGAVRRMVSHNGTAGHTLHRIVEFSYPWTPDSLLLMHSDGLSTHWSFEAYPGLLFRHPSVIAGVLFRDHARGRDDATVVVAKEETQAS